MKIIKGTNKGFFANVLDVARHISHSLKTGENWFVYWDNTPYNDIKVGSNSWEYYFLNRYSCIQTVTEEVRDYTSLELLPNHNFRQTMNFILLNYITINNYTQSLIDKTSKELEIDAGTLGVHIRKTDKKIGFMFGEPKSAEPLDINVYMKYIDLFLPKYRNIYIASDDINDFNTLVDYIKNAYPHKKISYIDAFRSKDSISIHNNYDDISGYRKGLDVLLDCCMLSRCGHLIRSTSNVGSTAQFINLNLTHTNINEIELGDRREIEYNL